MVSCYSNEEGFCRPNEYLGSWGTLYNPNFNPLEFEGFRNQAGLNALKDIKDSKERKVVVSLLVAQLILLERLQQMRYVLRAAFWKCNYHIFDYLRIQGQVGREDGDFDAGVKIFLKELLDGLCCPEPTEHHDAN